MVFAFHGYGDTGSGLRSYLGVEEVLGGKALFVYPDGQAQFETGGNSGWNREVGGEDVAFFDAMRERLAEDSCLDTDRVFSVGHSRGGRMVETLSCARQAVHRGFMQIAAEYKPASLGDALHGGSLRPTKSKSIFGHWGKQIGRASCRERVCYAV